MHHVNKRDVGTLPPGSSVFPIYSEFFCQKCNQCLKCQVSGHKSLGLLFEGHVMSPHHSINLIRCLVLIVIIVLIVLIIIIVPVVIIVLIQ